MYQITKYKFKINNTHKTKSMINNSLRFLKGKEIIFYSLPYNIAQPYAGAWKKNEISTSRQTSWNKARTERQLPCTLHTEITISKNIQTNRKWKQNKNKQTKSTDGYILFV